MQQPQPLTPARRGGKVDISLNMSNLTSLLIKSGVKINSDRQKIILGFGPISQMEAQHLTFTHRYNLGAGNQNKLKFISSPTANLMTSKYW